MPPSPARRISPGRELRAENHKRGRSLESGILYREKEDDLTLFNELQNKERENFLLQSNDDLDDIFLTATKLRYSSDYKLGISIPARGESSDLLNAEGDKNDYDWLITPPETPLFPSLDDETPPTSLARSGRPRSQPVSLSRSSTMEKGCRSGRGSASPHRLSPSPRPGSTTLQSRSRPFSAAHSSPPPTVRHFSPSRTPPLKSTPAPRSVTPTPRRMSTGSAGAATGPSRIRGTSPVRTSRGSSTSPKIRAWQSNIPGFSSEAPPNLRTSLTDRPTSYVRGSSPASRNGSRSGRQSVSPTASRSISSSHSHDTRDPFSSHSKGSVASSGDDDVDSLLSNVVSSSDRSAPRSVGAFPNNRATGFSKKPTKILSNSVPKRSFELAVRQTERKSPQNMFRPLLSSVPSSTFYIGKSTAHNRSLISRNSSITTSSNASSDQGTSGALDTEESEQNQEDVTNDFMKGQYRDGHDGVFVIDQADSMDEDVDNRIIEESPVCQHVEVDKFSTAISIGVATSVDTAGLVLDRKDDYLCADGAPDTALCSVCSRNFCLDTLTVEGDLLLCLECKGIELNSTITIPLGKGLADRTNVEDFGQFFENGVIELKRSPSNPEPLQVTCAGETSTDHFEKTANECHHSYSEPSQDLEMPSIDKPVDDAMDHQPQMHSGVGSNSKADVSEGTGISLLLKRSSSGKGRIFRSTSLTTSNISYDDFSYVMDSTYSMRSSVGHSSTSVSSSVDLGSSRQTEPRSHQQSSGQKSDMESYRYEMPAKHKRSVSSLSGYSSHMIPVTPRSVEDSFEIIASSKGEEAAALTYVDPHPQILVSEWTEVESACRDVESTSQLINFHSQDNSLAAVLTSEEPASLENDKALTNGLSNLINEETPSTHLQNPPQREDAMPSSCGDTVDVAEVSHPSSLDAPSEVEIQIADILSANSKNDVDLTNLECCTNELVDPSVSTAQDDAMTTNVHELEISDAVLCISEESTIILEDAGGTNSRSLTLEEATDAILFCSNIVNNLAYEAANIAIDKENPPVEDVLRPTVTFVGKSTPNRRELRSRTAGKRSSKSQKAQTKKLETDAKSPPIAESEEKYTPRIVRSPSKADSSLPPKLESKCNCTIM